MNATSATTIRTANRRSLSCLRQAGPLLLLLVAMAGLPAAASAATVIQCVGTETIDFSPGLTLTPKATTIALTVDLATCTGISDPPVTSSFLQIAPTFSASCLGPVDGLLIPITVVYTWNTGDTSTIHVTATGTRAGAVQVITAVGEIIDGLFAGASVVTVQTLPIPSVLHCLAPPGVTEISGPTTMTITLAE